MNRSRSAVTGNLEKRLGLGLFLGLIACLALFLGDGNGSSVHAEPPAPEAAAPESGTTAASDTKNVFVIYSVNVTGEIDVCGCKRKKVRQGSITRRGSYIRQARHAHPHTVVLDAGNTLVGPDDKRTTELELEQTMAKAKVLIESYNRLGYGAMGIGNFDLLLGMDRLRALEKQAKFPFLSANLVDAETGETVFPATHEIESGGVKIGLLGLTLEGIPEYYLEKASPDRALKITDALAAAEHYVPTLAARNDVVIVFSINDAARNREIAEKVEGIDFLVDPLIELGNHKLWVDDELLVEVKDDTNIIRMDAQGARVGTLDVFVRPKPSRPIVDGSTGEVPEGRSEYWFEKISLEPHMLEDPEIAAIVDAYREQASVVDVAKLPPLPHKEKYLTADTCKVCHVPQYEFWKKTSHADAFASLEETGDQWRQDCIACHVLGYGQAFLAPADAEPYKDVQCENCHGLNPGHPTDPAAHPWPKIEEESCLVCHNKEQTRSDFHFFQAKPKIACPPLERTP